MNIILVYVLATLADILVFKNEWCLRTLFVSICLTFVYAVYGMGLTEIARAFEYAIMLSCLVVTYVWGVYYMFGFLADRKRVIANELNELRKVGASHGQDQ